MQDVFLKLVQLSLTGSLFAFAVMLVRMIFRKAPKWLFCLLWGVVALRLICPVSIESKFSLVPDLLASGQLIGNAGDDYIGEVDIFHESSDGYSNAVEAGRQPIYSEGGYYVVTENDSFEEPKTVENTVYPILSWVWLTGMILMLCYTAVSYALLKRKLEEATLLRDHIWQCEQVDSPFVLGIVKPRIYISYQLSESDMEHVIAHEQAHICRRDHWWKPIGFLLLSVYWFNPVMWAAYILLCRDIEAACDEKVIRHMDKDKMRAYSTALLHCSIHRRLIAACPLAFGEVGTKERIKHVMNYRKPAFWIIIMVIVVSIAAGVLLLTEPVRNDPEEVWDFTGRVTGIQDAETHFVVKVTDEGSSSLTVGDSVLVQTDLEGSPELAVGDHVNIAFDGVVEDTPGVSMVSAKITGVFSIKKTTVVNDEDLLALIQEIVSNPDCAASSNPFDYIKGSQSKYNEILTYGGDAVAVFTEQLRSGGNGLPEYIMAVACAEITGIGNKYDEADWATAQEWLFLYDSSEHDSIVPMLIATDYITGQQAKLLSFGYSASKVIACGIAPWEGAYGGENTLVLDGLWGQNEILLAPQGFTFSSYRIYLPDGTVYDDGTRELYDSQSLCVMYNDDGIGLIAPFQTGEYIYELVLVWPEEDMEVTYGLKVVMTGKESTYDVALRKVFERYGEGNPLAAVSLVGRFTLANAAAAQQYYVFEVENLPDGTKKAAVSTDGQTLYEVVSTENGLEILQLVEEQPDS